MSIGAEKWGKWSPNLISPSTSDRPEIFWRLDHQPGASKIISRSEDFGRPIFSFRRSNQTRSFFLVTNFNLASDLYKELSSAWCSNKRSSTSMERRKRSSVLHVPEEIIYKVLISLPGKSVLRFQLVSRTWGAIISDPSFRQAHHLRAEPALTVMDRHRHLHSISLHGRDNMSENGATGDIVAQIYRLSNIKKIKAEGYGPYMLDHCDGLLLLDVYDHNTGKYSFYIHNPLTAQCLPVPSSPEDGCVCSLYFHPDSNEYRLLSYFGEDYESDDSIYEDDIYEEDGSFGYNILTVGTRAWRQIETLYDSAPNPYLDVFATNLIRFQLRTICRLQPG